MLMPKRKRRTWIEKSYNLKSKGSVLSLKRHRREKHNVLYRPIIANTKRKINLQIHENTPCFFPEKGIKYTYPPRDEKIF